MERYSWEWWRGLESVVPKLQKEVELWCDWFVLVVLFLWKFLVYLFTLKFFLIINTLNKINYLGQNISQLEIDLVEGCGFFWDKGFIIKLAWPTGVENIQEDSIIEYIEVEWVLSALMRPFWFNNNYNMLSCWIYC